jgi:predicted hydrocarbon binding protein
MPSQPSIKGSVFAGVIEDVCKLVRRGGVSVDELTRWLKPQDMDLLEQKIVVSEWYDIAIYTRMNELLRDVEGGGSNEYLRQLGRRTARRLLESGLYQQLEYVQRTELSRAQEKRVRFEAFGRDLRLLATLSGSILNFSRWKSKPDPEEAGRYVIEVSEAKDFPEVLCWRSDGLINEMATQHGEPDLWRWERTADDLVAFRMVRSL